MTKKQEQAAEAATTPEITGETEAKTEHKTPCVYCGPSVRGVARQYTVYASGNTPAALDEFVKQHPAAKNLLVPVERFAQTRKALETAGTAESILYNKMLEEWFEYGGQPGTFRLYINVTDTTEEHPAIIYSPAEMERRLITAKRWSAHLESLSYMVRHTLATGCRVDKWAYTVPECGTIYCGAWWMPATLGYTAHHALLTGGQPGAFAVSPEFTGTLPVPATVGYSVCGALRSGGVATGYTASPEFAGTLPEEAQHGN